MLNAIVQFVFNLSAKRFRLFENRVFYKYFTNILGVVIDFTLLGQIPQKGKELDGFT